jgi:hypothetical protein
MSGCAAGQTEAVVQAELDEMKRLLDVRRETKRHRDTCLCADQIHRPQPESKVVVFNLG